MGLRRSAARDTGAGVDSTVPEAPAENLGLISLPGGSVSRWQNGPAPAGALLRGYRSTDPDSDAQERIGSADDDDHFISRRAAKLHWWRRLPASMAGRIALGVGVFAGVSVVALGIAEVRDFLRHDPRFEITTSAAIETSGNSHLTRAQLLRVFGADIERNIFRVPLADRRADLERLPWVEQATVMRLLPNHLRVFVKERVPVAFVRQGTQVGLVDSHGVLLDMPAAQDGENYSFPVLTGVLASDPLSTRAARMALYGEFMKALEGAGKNAAKSLSEVDLSDPEDVRALIAHGPGEVLVHFGDEDYLKRYQAFAEHADEWQQQHPRLASVDMRYEGQVVLGMGNTTHAADAPALPTTASAPIPAASAVARPAPAPVVAKAEAPHLLQVQKAATPRPPVTVAAVQPPTPPATPKPTQTPKPMVVKASADSTHKPVVKAAVAHPAAHGAGFSTSNERMFAALAAEHRALAASNLPTKSTPANSTHGATR